MKKLVYYISLYLAFLSFSLHAKSNGTQLGQTTLTPTDSTKKVYDKELSVHLCDENGTIIQCTQPEVNGNFYFENLKPGKYSIIVINKNGIQSEAYTVKCNKSDINCNLSKVMTPSNLANQENSKIETHSCEAKSPLQLSISTTPLDERGDLEFYLHNKSDVKILITDDNKSIVYTLPLGEVQPGVHTVNFDVSDLSGDYSVSAKAGKEISTCQIRVR